MQFQVGAYMQFQVSSLLANERIIRFWNSWLMYISIFRLCQVVSIMEIPGGFGFNLVLWPA
ncbi:unnamed protein product, partial [Rotaria socialis]